MDPHRTDNTQTQGHSVYFRSLVCFRNQGDHCHFAENHSRFRRVSARIVSVQYPAPGDPALARRVQKLLAPIEVELDNSWGLDHGTWSVLRHVYPAADIPVVELSIDERKLASFHFEIGKKLCLAERGPYS